jgi:hypothetical protein
LMLGHFLLAALWVPQYQRSRGIRAAVASGAGNEPAVAAETHFPVPIVVLHGLLGSTTIVLVLLSALEIGTYARARHADGRRSPLTGGPTCAYPVGP